MKGSFVIEGSNGIRVLEGEIKVNGAKNATLPLLAAAPLFSGPVKLSNVPRIEDVARMSELMELLNISSTRNQDQLTINSAQISGTELDRNLSKKMRASIILTGSMLGTLGEVRFPYPGGCVLGKRPIDIFLDGYRKMGAEVMEDGEWFFVKAKKGGLRGAEIFCRLQSMTATEAFLLAAVSASGETIINNAAMEPEIIALGNFLIAGGAKITGLGTTKITILGRKEKLTPPTDHYSVIPDRIEAGSFLILASLLGKDVKITNCMPDHLSILIEVLREAGVPIEVGSNFMRVYTKDNSDNKTFKAFDFKTHEYPGFPTDLQAPTVVFLTQATGESTVFETIFEGRLNYTEDLVRMGASIEMLGTNRARIKGPTPLKGRELDGPDIRAGLAYVIAGLLAEGESKINNVYYIDRGYEKIEDRLRGIGAKISRLL